MCYNVRGGGSSTIEQRLKARLSDLVILCLTMDYSYMMSLIKILWRADDCVSEQTGEQSDGWQVVMRGHEGHGREQMKSTAELVWISAVIGGHSDAGNDQQLGHLRVKMEGWQTRRRGRRLMSFHGEQWCQNRSEEEADKQISANLIPLFPAAQTSCLQTNDTHLLAWLRAWTPIFSAKCSSYEQR